MMAQVGLKLDIGGPVSLARSLSYIHESGFHFEGLDEKSQEKYDVMARLIAKGGTGQ